MLNYVFKFCCSSREKDQPELQKSDILQQEPIEQEENFNTFFEEKRAKQQQHSLETQQLLQPGDENVLVRNESSSMNTDEYLILDSNQMNQVHLSQEDILIENTFVLPRIRFCEDVKKKIRKRDQNQKRSVKLWENEEDTLLSKYYRIYEGNWENIAKMIPGRNISQCSQRWRRMNPQPAKNKWSSQEDQMVIAMVNLHGKNWGLISKNLHDRSGKQVRERYLNKLDPNLNTQQWTQEEDDIILQNYQIQGTKWSKIAMELQGRSENMVKNRFYTFIKRVMLGQTNPYQIVYNQESMNNCTEDFTNKSSSEFDAHHNLSSGLKNDSQDVLFSRLSFHHGDSYQEEDQYRFQIEQPKFDYEEFSLWNDH